MIENEVKSLVKQHIRFQSVVNMTEDLTRLGLDSMGTINLLLDLEERFEMTIPDEYLINGTFSSIQNIINGIRSIKYQDS